MEDISIYHLVSTLTLLVTVPLGGFLTGFFGFMGVKVATKIFGPITFNTKSSEDQS